MNNGTGGRIVQHLDSDRGNDGTVVNGVGGKLAGALDENIRASVAWVPGWKKGKQ